MDSFPVTLSAGSLRADPAGGWLVPHAWTDGGVVVEAAPNGAGVLHVAVALCVLNDTFREAGQRGLAVTGVRVSARGEFDEETWRSTGVSYAVEVDSTDDVAAAQARLAGAGLATATEDEVACCYAVQDKVWVDGPDREPWEIYTVLSDVEMAPGELRTVAPGDDSMCCGSAPESAARCC